MVGSFFQKRKNQGSFFSVAAKEGASLPSFPLITTSWSIFMVACIKASQKSVELWRVSYVNSDLLLLVIFALKMLLASSFLEI
jgi:hypothetical protein